MYAVSSGVALGDQTRRNDVPYNMGVDTAGFLMYEASGVLASRILPFEGCFEIPFYGIDAMSSVSHAMPDELVDLVRTSGIDGNMGVSDVIQLYVSDSE